MKIKVNRDLKGVIAGTTIEVPDEKGIPLNRFWRDRLKDAKIDNCCEVVVWSSKVKSKAKTQEKIDD